MRLNMVIEKGNTDFRQSRYAAGVICILLVTSVLLVYWQVLNSDFVNYDDPMYVTENEHVQAGLTWKGVVWAFSGGYASNWHPVTWLSHMADCELFGLNPCRHHLTSLLLHIANTLLLFFVLKKMTGAMGASGFAAAVFALHPLHVQSVAWVAERKDVLSTLFWLLTMWTYVSYVRRRGALRYLLSLGLFALGLMSKPMLVSLPVVMLILDYWPLNRFRQGRPCDIEDRKSLTFFGLVLEKVPFFILAAASSFITFMVQRKSGAVIALDKLGFGERLCNGVVSYAVYIIKTFIPDRLAVYYPYFPVPAWQVIGAAMLLIAITAAVFVSRRRYLISGWLWYMVTLVPVIGLVQVGSQSRADRYMYVPMTGLLIMIAWGVSDIATRLHLRKYRLVPAASLCIASLMVCAWFQVGYWHDSFTLLTNTLKVTEENHIAHLNLGNVLLKQGKTEETIDHYKKAVEINPEFVDARFNLGVALLLDNRPAEAIEQYDKLLKMGKESWKLHFYMANALAKRGQIDEALEHYRIALEKNPNDFEIHNNMALALVEKGNFDEAVEQFKIALAIKPDSPEVHYNLGNALKKQGRVEEAFEQYDRIVKEKTADIKLCLNMAEIMSEVKRYEEAAEYYRRAIEIEPENIISHGKLGLVLAEQGKIDEAIKECRIVLIATPDDVEMRCNVGILLENQGKIDDAIAEYRVAIQTKPDYTKALQLLEAALSKQQSSGLLTEKQQ